MANRVLLGKKGSEYGLWVSKVGQDVTSAGSNNLLFDSSFLTLNFTKSGIKRYYTSYPIRQSNYG